jgi:hypothetical protein
MSRRIGGLFCVPLMLVAFAATALAQGDVTTYPAAARWSLGGEIAAAAAPKDDEAFFNYTDYSRNALRVTRLRLFGEWRWQDGISLVSELRVENASIDLAAAYLRWRPWAAHELDVQAGRIPPLVGAFARRAYGRDNAVIGFPLAYQYLTSLRPDALPATLDDVVAMRARGWQPSYPIGVQSDAPGIPLVSASRWDTGVEVRWLRGALELAGAVGLGAPAVPVVRETNGGRQWSGRAAWHAPFGLQAAISGARGTWVEQRALDLIPIVNREATQQVVAADIEFGRGRWLIRAETLRAAFAVPMFSAPARTLTASSAFLEARYRFHPRWQGAVRVDRLRFADLPSGPWDAPVDRAEAVIGYRVTRTFDVRAGLQHDRREGGRVRRATYPVAQILFWF